MNPAHLVCLLVVAGLVRGDDLQVLSSATSEFSQRLYQKIAVDKPNTVYSPYSIHSALTMTSLGARAETATEFSQSLGLTSLAGTSAHQAYHNIVVQMNAVREVKLHTANAVFLNPNVKIESQFIDNVKADYLATTSNFDLAAVGGPEKAINDFVDEKTAHLIPQVLAPGTIDASTVMVLINTIFFNGTWATQFPAARTQQQDFHKLGGVKSQVAMMKDERFAKIKRNVNGVDVAELPFKGGRFSLYIALPQTVDGITALEHSLATPGNVDQLFEGLSSTNVLISIPKFKIESSFELNSALKDLGIKKAFDPSQANFQGISNTGYVYISEVIHKAVIEVKETGTVAAAVTAIIVDTAAIISPPPAHFTADHPFLFFLRDNQSNEILFQGKFSG